VARVPDIEEWICVAQGVEIGHQVRPQQPRRGQRRLMIFDPYFNHA
jgi:hypothetical protein